MKKLLLIGAMIILLWGCHKEEAKLITQPDLSICSTTSELYALEMRHGYELLYYWSLDSLAGAVINDLIKADISYDLTEKYDCEALERALDNVKLLKKALNNYIIVDLYHQDLVNKEVIIREYLIKRGDTPEQIRAYTIISLLPHETIERLEIWIAKNYPILEKAASTGSPVGAF